MSTRAVYVFQNTEETYAVYKHSDGYPSAALKFIAAAEKMAWALPRFEPDEFAAAFVAANKHDAGGVRLLNYDKDETCFPVDIEYIYRVTCRPNQKVLWVDIFSTLVPDWDEPESRHSEKLFSGPLPAAVIWQHDNAA